MRPPTIQALDDLGICLRPCIEADYPFLESLFAQSRVQEFASLDLPKQNRLSHGTKKTYPNSGDKPSHLLLATPSHLDALAALC